MNEPDAKAMPMHQILFVDSDVCTDAHWQEYFELLENLKSRHKEHLAATTWQELKARTLSFGKKEKLYREAIILADGRVEGYLGLIVRNPGTPDQHAWGWFSADCEEISEPLSEVMKRQYLTLMDEHDVEELHFATRDDRTTAVAHAWQAEKLNRLDEYTLDREAADLETIDRWLAEIPQNSPELRLEFFVNIPEEYIGRYCRLLSECLKSMPREREDNFSWHIDENVVRSDMVWRKDNDVPSYCFGLFDGDDRMVAMTETAISRSNLETIDQLMTGVTEACRGKGLARWLKAAMYKKLVQDFPKFGRLMTVMRAVNEPMQHINAQMGFRLNRAGFEFVLKRSELK